MVAVGFGFILGAILGSFIKAAADRVIIDKSLWGRSYCPHCKKTLRWYDLLPLLSYLFLKGRCRFCQKRIPQSDLFTELAVGLIVAVLFWLLVSPSLELLLFPNWKTALFLLDLLFKLFVIIVILIVFIIDFKTGLILDCLTYPAALVAFFYLLISSGVKSFLFYQSLKNSALAKYLMPPVSGYLLDHLQRIWTPAGLAILSGIGLAGIFAGLIILTRGKGMGWGDAKYVLFIGLALGFPNSLVAVFLAFLVGATVSVLLIVFGKKHFGQTIPFGPFLSLGTLISLLFGTQIINWYLRIF